MTAALLQQKMINSRDAGKMVQAMGRTPMNPCVLSSRENTWKK